MFSSHSQTTFIVDELFSHTHRACVTLTLIGKSAPRYEPIRLQLQVTVSPWKKTKTLFKPLINFLLTVITYVFSLLFHINCNTYN